MVNQVLWDTKDLAKFFKYSTQWVRQNLCKIDEFPAPVIPGRWHPDTVKKWAEDKSSTHTPEHPQKNIVKNWDETLSARLPKKDGENSLVIFPKSNAKFPSN